MHKSFFKAAERLTVTMTLNYVQYELMMNNNLVSVDVFLHTHKIRRFKSQEQCLFWMVLSYNRPNGHLLTRFKGKEGTYIEMYDMYAKSYENNYVLDRAT